MRTSHLAAVSALASLVAGKNDFRSLGLLVPPTGDELHAELFAAAAVNTTGSAYFTQWLDHDDPSKGTFQQRYWWSSKYWAGPGSPVSRVDRTCQSRTKEVQVVFFTPGEAAAAPYGSYLTNTTISGLYAQEIRGAVILFERRHFWHTCYLISLTCPRSLLRRFISL